MFEKILRDLPVFNTTLLILFVAFATPILFKTSVGVGVFNGTQDTRLKLAEAQTEVFSAIITRLERVEEISGISSDGNAFNLLDNLPEGTIGMVRDDDEEGKISAIVGMTPATSETAVIWDE